MDDRGTGGLRRWCYPKQWWFSITWRLKWPSRRAPSICPR